MEKDNSVNNKSGIVTGIVKCEKLNVRKSPSLMSEVIDILAKKTKIKVNLDKSTQNFYHIHNDGMDGFCAKEFIKIN